MSQQSPCGCTSGMSFTLRPPKCPLPPFCWSSHLCSCPFPGIMRQGLATRPKFRVIRHIVLEPGLTEESSIIPLPRGTRGGDMPPPPPSDPSLDRKQKVAPFGLSQNVERTHPFLRILASRFLSLKPLDATMLENSHRH